MKNNVKYSHSSELACMQPQISLHDKNWFGTGGKAHYFAQPTTQEQFSASLQFATQQQLPITLLGHGANVLIADEGVAGLVIRPALESIHIVHQEMQHSFVRADAGVSMPALIAYCLDHNLIGLEEFSGIPGTVGGSVFINLHYFTHLLSDYLVEAQVIEKNSGIVKTVPKTWFEFGYNYSKLHEQQHYLCNATFALKSVDAYETAYARGRHAEIIRHRNQRYPLKNTCGSFFRNFFDHEVILMRNGKKIIYVAYYLDKIGVKGQLCIGDALVSYQHANMIVNQGNACSADIIQLARIMQQKVYDAFGILPQPECRLLGFSEYPLL